MTKKDTISFFSITGLYGERNISIPFDSQIKILVGENGTGKTTVLNTLYYLLSNQIYKLRQIPFKTVCLEFSSREKVTIKKSDITRSYENLHSSDFYRHLKRRLPRHHFEDLIETYEKSPPATFRRSVAFRTASRRLDMPSSMLADLIDRLFIETSSDKASNNKKEKSKTQKSIDKIQEKFNCEIK